MVKSYNGLSKLVKLVLQFFFGWFISPVYRILVVLSKKISLLKLILFVILYIILFPLIWIIDFVTIILYNRITFLVM